MVNLKNECGSATIVSLAMGGLIVGAGFILLSVLQLAIVRAELGSYADLAALAASTQQESPCSAAEHVAQANNVELTACAIESGAVRVTVGFTQSGLGVTTWFVGDLHVSARANYLPALFL